MQPLPRPAAYYHLTASALNVAPSRGHCTLCRGQPVIESFQKIFGVDAGIIFIFPEDFCTHCAFHVIWARSDFDCTGVAQTHVLTSERSEKLQKDGAEKRSDLELHFRWILTPFWVRTCFHDYVFWVGE